MKKYHFIFGGLEINCSISSNRNIKRKWINSEVDLIDLTSYAAVKREWALDYLEMPKKINKLDYFILKVKRFLNQKLTRLGILKIFLMFLMKNNLII